MMNMSLTSSNRFDVAVFAVAHREYRDMDLKEWIAGNDILIFDANRVLSPGQIKDIGDVPYRFSIIGRGIGEK